MEEKTLAGFDPNGHSESHIKSLLDNSVRCAHSVPQLTVPGYLK